MLFSKMSSYCVGWTDEGQTGLAVREINGRTDGRDRQAKEQGDSQVVRHMGVLRGQTCLETYLGTYTTTQTQTHGNRILIVDIWTKYYLYFTNIKHKSTKMKLGLTLMIKTLLKMSTCMQCKHFIFGDNPPPPYGLFKICICF